MSTNQPIVKHHWAIIINNQNHQKTKALAARIPQGSLPQYLLHTSQTIPQCLNIPQTKTRHKKEKSVKIKKRIKKRIRFNWKVDVMDHRQSHAGYTPPAKIHKSTQQSRERKRKRKIGDNDMQFRTCTPHLKTWKKVHHTMLSGWSSHWTKRMILVL